MNRRRIARNLGFLVALAMSACSNRASDSPPSGSAPSDAEAWLLSKPTETERFASVARQLRGFDVAMVETGYRYVELHWAGADENWDYAKYQVEKIRTAVNNGVERRPKRGASAQMLEGALVGIEEALGAKDAALFTERFQALTATCNACHQAERVPFIHVRPPQVRCTSTGPAVGEVR